MSKNTQNKSITTRENFLLGLLNKVIIEYKKLYDQTKKNKPLKIVEISTLSTIPGETIFTIQITDKNCIARLSAAEIIEGDYNLNDFNDYHADLIRKAAQGKIVEFLQLSATEPIYKIVSKRYDSSLKQYIFTIETNDNIRFDRTSDEIASDKNLLTNITTTDSYDVGFTHGTETILNESALLARAKNNN